MGDVKYLLPQQRNKSKGSDFWYGGISNGVVKWVSLKTKSKKVAMEWYNKMQSLRYAPPQEHKTEERVKIIEAMDAFIADVEKTRRRTQGTVKEYIKHLHQFRKFCAGRGIADMGEITALICSEFARDELSNLAGSTARTKIIVLRSFCRWASENYALQGKNPFSGIVTYKPKPAPRKFWTVEECEKIIEAASDDECRCWFALMSWAGLRKEEARKLKMENLECGKISLVGKGGKAATLPISGRLKECLSRYLAIRGDAPGYLFPRLASLAINLTRLIKNAAGKAGVSNAETAHVHRFRHSFASNLLRMGRSIKAVQMLMRHENVTLTLNKYGHLLPSDLEKEVEL